MPIKSTKSANSPYVDDKVVDELIETQKMCTERQLSKMTAYHCKQILKVERVFTDRYLTLYANGTIKNTCRISCFLPIGYLVDYLADVS